MPTMKERGIVAKLMLMLANAFDENRKDFGPYADGEMRPEFTLAELRPTVNEAMAEAQKMLAAWGGEAMSDDKQVARNLIARHVDHYSGDLEGAIAYALMAARCEGIAEAATTAEHVWDARNEMACGCDAAIAKAIRALRQHHENSR